MASEPGKVPINNKIVIVGAGWAGLSAAMTACKQGYQVTLVESARHVGGRARTVNHNELELDNGQHIMLGAYEGFLGLLKDTGTREEDVIIRKRLALTSRSLKDHKRFLLRTPKLPAPLHLLAGLLLAKGLTISDKMAAIRFWRMLERKHFKLETDITLAELFQQSRQTPALVKKLWEPLCIAALNTPIATASAQVFINVLQRSFTGNKSNSDILLPRKDLGAIFPDRALSYIEQQGGKILIGNRVTDLVIENNLIKGVALDNETIEADFVVLSTPFTETARLIKKHSALKNLYSILASFHTEPICTLYLQYKEPVSLADDMTGLLDSTSQWVFDRRFCNQEGIVGVVISASGEHMKLDNDRLARLIIDELSQLDAHLANPIDYLLIREKRATFSCTPGIQQQRPENRTTVQGLWLAGDYTQTNLPATLEGAIQSGLQCIEQISQTNS